MGCLHDPANVHQLTCILNTFAGRLLDRVNFLAVRKGPGTGLVPLQSGNAELCEAGEQAKQVRSSELSPCPLMF